VEGVIATIMIVLTGTLFLVWRAQVRRPGRWRPWFREGTWLRAMGWTAALTAAAAIGSLLSGGRDIAVLAVTVGAGVLMVLVIFWSFARTFGQRDDT
jgi:hypothetical protein